MSGNFSRNYQVIKSQVQKEGFNGLNVLSETNRRVDKMRKHINDDLRPVSVDEGLDLFNDYYNNLEEKNRKQRRDLDFSRKKQNVLKPGEFKSYLFRPGAGKAKSGPENYDLEGVDDATENIIGHGLPPLDNMISTKPRSKRHQ